MGAEQYVCWRMWCDKCRQPLFRENFGPPETWPDFWTEVEAYHEARKQGWVFGHDSYWYCPDC